MSSTHYQSAREHLVRAEELNQAVQENIDRHVGVQLTAAEAYALTENHKDLTGRAHLFVKLAEVHIALAGCPVE